MKSPEYTAGLLVGFGLVIILFALVMLRKSRKVPKPKFDEMQLAARGKAFEAGFFGLLFANLAGACLSTVEVLKASPFVIFGATCMAGIAIFVVSAIRNDAYFGFNENKKSSTTFIAVMGLINFAIGLLNIRRKGLFDGPELNVAVLNLCVALLSAVIVTAVLLHKRADGSDTEGEEE